MARKFSKTSDTWIMFERIMLNRRAEQGDYTFPPMPKGKAINLTQGLNGCQIQWQRETGAPDSVLLFSAKAKQLQPAVMYADLWVVEISRNHTRQGRKSASSQWLTELLETVPSAPDTVPGMSQAQWEAAEAEVARLTQFAPSGKGDAFEGRLMQDLAQMPLPSEVAQGAFTEPEHDPVKEAQIKHHVELTRMHEKSTWVCPSCEMPVLGIHGSRIIKDEAGNSSRICGDCVDKMKVARGFVL
jgi:hypothetical protein